MKSIQFILNPLPLLEKGDTLILNTMEAIVNYVAKGRTL